MSNDKEIKEDLFVEASNYCKNILDNTPEHGHDWLHTLRVLHIAEKIAQTETGNLFAIRMGALFHDIADSKFNNSNDDKGWKLALSWMQQNKLDYRTSQIITHIIKNISWHKGYQYNAKDYPELAIVQDADRLDAIGAIGIARAFNYGGFKKRPLYSINQDDKHSTLKHFYDKLIRIKDTMHTKTGKRMAEERHLYLMNFITTFEKEINSSFINNVKKDSRDKT